MVKEQQKEIMMNFKKCCRLYNSWKSELQYNRQSMQRIIHEQKVEQKKNEEINAATQSVNIDNCEMYADEYIEKLIYRELVENINLIDNIFSKIDQLFGSDAKDIVWQIYVDGKKEKEIEMMLGISRRTLYLKLDEWLTGALFGRKS